MENNKLDVILEKITGHVRNKFIKKSKSNNGSSNIDAPEKIMGISKEKYLMAKVIERISEIDTITSTGGDAKHAHLKINDVVGLMVLLDEAISNNDTLFRSFDDKIKTSSYQVIDNDGEID